MSARSFAVCSLQPYNLQLQLLVPVFAFELRIFRNQAPAAACAVGVLALEQQRRLLSPAPVMEFSTVLQHISSIGHIGISTARLFSSKVGGASVFFQSSLPSRNSANSLNVSDKAQRHPKRCHGRANRPVSSRFANRHNPVPSKYSTFARSRIAPEE